MKKEIVLFIVFSAMTFKSLDAATVSVPNAQAIALNFFKLTFPNQTGHTNITAVLKYTQTEPDSSVDFYVFDMTPLNGFVIVAAHDEIIPIIAYSNESCFLLNFQGSGLADWVNKTAGQIKQTVTAQIPADEHINHLWSSYALGFNPGAEKSNSLGPMLSTTWNQEPYYNATCPINPADGQRSVTGCVATAMAQIMKFWNYPAQGIGSFSYVDDNAHGYQINAGTLSANFGATTYQWTQMPNHLTSNNTAVDALMSHCGISVAMDYSDGGSGAWVLQSEANSSYGYAGAPSAQHSFVTYFKYNPATIQGVHQSSYTATQWINLLESDMNTGRVIQYQGTDPHAGGHTWVCDGYDVNNKLHMNWGWGGAANGFYAANNLNAGGYDFYADDAALIGIVPLYPNVDTGCTASAAFTYQNEGGSVIQFTNTSTSNHTFSSAWTFYNAAGQFATSTATNPQITFTGSAPYSAHLAILDTFNHGCSDTITHAVTFDPNTTCITLQVGQTKAVGSEIEDLYPTQNYDYTTMTDFIASHWTHAGTPTENRGLLKYDISQIPAGSVVVSARLSLYADSLSIYDHQGEPTYGSDNASNIFRLTGPWDPATVTWSTQPSYTTNVSVLLAQSVNTDEDYLDLDITSFVQAWVDTPVANYGLMMKIITTNYYNTMIFCSPGNANTAKLPKLDICFIPPAKCHAHASFVQQNLGGGQVLFTNTSTDNSTFTSHWTFFNGAGQVGASALTNPTQTFAGPTPYRATLIIIDSTCSDTITQTVNINNCVTFQYGATKATGAEIEDFFPTQNFDYTAMPDFITSHWTHGGTPTENRGLLKYDVSQIPAGSVILSAALSVYADNNSTYDQPNEPTYGTDNASEIYLLTSVWNPTTVTWNTQPTVNNANPVQLAQSTSVSEDYLNLDVSTYVQGWVNNPSTNYGVMLKMITPNYYNTMIFGSPGNADSTKWPRLDICYQIASPCHIGASFTQQDMGNGQVQFTNTSTNNGHTSVNWAFSNGNGQFITSTAQNPLINFTGPSPYTATLQINDTTSGCIDTLSKPINITTGISDNGNVNNELYIFPNPNNGNYFTLRLPSGYIAETTEIKIIDVLGREVELPTIERYSDYCKVSMDKAKSAGIYTVIVSNSSGQQFGKLVLVK